ncbi:MAG: mechanosensitive ion channel [Flavobacteriales bacterium]|nr:mechanosensitive ion channel [Flavobacteriales bacterium]
MIENIFSITNNFSNWLISKGISDDAAPFVRLVIVLFVLFVLLFIVDFVAKKIMREGVRKIFTKTKNKWDDVLIDKRVFAKLAHIFPAALFNLSIHFVFVDFPIWISISEKIIHIYIIIILLAVAVSAFNALEYYFSNSKKFKDKPIESYFQLAKLVSYFVTGIYILSIILGKSPIYLLGAFGAMTAILLLIFKDTILGFVASIQIATNDMVRVNDWVEMEKYGADGNIIKITLNTVKVKNWDNTITTIPTYALVSDSFKNWRGMQETGARRIKRHINIRPASIKFTDVQMLEKFKKFQLVAPYISQRQTEIENSNTTLSIDKAETINGRNLTNIGIFREYAELYLRNHSQINENMTLMVRQLQSNQYGLPLEIYCFAKTIDWVKYEGIQSDILDHLIAAAGFFDLEVYELSVTA